MGGCYREEVYSTSSRQREPEVPNWQASFNRAIKSGKREDFSLAYRQYEDKNVSGFIMQAAKALGISKAEDIPKEFPDTEYEIKFDIIPRGKGEEPTVLNYLEAFDFPANRNARFLADPVRSFAIGTNRFYGTDTQEHLVVIEKGGKTYLKEKGIIVPLSTGVKYEEAVLKRKETRWAASLDEVFDKVGEVLRKPGVKHVGTLRKEKGDDFILDVSDGRVYSFTVTRASHLQSQEPRVQRQLEIEYAGYLPGFNGFKKDSEKQIVENMIDLARYTAGLHSDAPLGEGWRMNLALTGERKYDFVLGRNTQTNRKSQLALNLSAEAKN